MTRKSILILVAVLALVAVGVFTVSAQSNTTTPTCPGMGGNGHGMMGNRGYGMMAGVDDDTMMAAAAKAFGLDTTTFIQKIHSGTTMADLAKTQNVDVQTVYDAMLATAKDHMDTLVKAGTITQAQADEHLTWMKDNVANMPMFGGSGNCAMGNGMGMMGNGQGMMGDHGMGMGNGMMGRGHGMGMMGNGQGMMGQNS